MPGQIENREIRNFEELKKPMGARNKLLADLSYYTG